ncbi:MAG: DUF177 domain-containing protein [Oscillospiraceae bacterium]|nr:DUF177 domain-containing protein [Oscillospiraceae bacterium]
MLVDIRPAREGDPLAFLGSVDLRGLRLWGEAPFSAPVNVDGSVYVRHGQVEIDYTVGYTRSGHCARCMAETAQSGSLRFNHPVKEIADETGFEDIIPAPGGLLNMTELAGADLLLTFVSPLLCREDCRGLCCQCGVDLNYADCDCAGLPPMSPNKVKIIIKEVPANGGSKDENK